MLVPLTYRLLAGETPSNRQPAVEHDRGSVIQLLGGIDKHRSLGKIKKDRGLMPAMSIS